MVSLICNNLFDMKNFKIICCLILGLFFSIYAIAQDTIFYKNASKVVVFVKEVSQTEVQYKKIELPDGPMYILSKNDIDKIVYKNGYTEIIKLTEPLEKNTIQSLSSTTNQSVQVDINYDKISYNDTKKRHSSLLYLIDRHPDPNRRNILIKDAVSMKNLKRHQGGTRTGAIIFAGVAIAGTVLYGLISSFNYGQYVDPIYAVPPVAFGTLAVALGATSIAINVKLRQKRKSFVRDYNE